MSPQQWWRRWEPPRCLAPALDALGATLDDGGMSASSNDSPGGTPDTQRRSFLSTCGAIGAGTLVAAFPFAAGWGVVTAPARSSSTNSSEAGSDDGFVRVCPLDAVPADGTPQAFPVIADLVDAWTRAPNQRIGEVFLSRSDKDGKPHVLAITAACPHLGCAVEFSGANSQFECPCHASGFAKDGKKLFGPSLRGLDELEVKLEEGGGSTEVWVRFERFRAGVAERIPVA
jgi:menaquinol-cytochrome c reductase iron-sulfur subunit